MDFLLSFEYQIPKLIVKSCKFVQNYSISRFFSYSVMTSIVFNSVPMHDIDCDWGINPALDRVKALIREIKR